MRPRWVVRLSERASPKSPSRTQHRQLPRRALTRQPLNEPVLKPKVGRTVEPVPDVVPKVVDGQLTQQQRIFPQRPHPFLQQRQQLDGNIGGGVDPKARHPE